MLLELAVILPIYLILCLIYLRFRHIIKAMSEADDFFADMNMNIAKEAWMSDDEFKDFCAYHKMLQTFNKTYANHPLMKSFSKCRYASFVFCSNRLENTIPIKVRQSDTFKLLESLCDDDILTESKVNSRWNSDGSPYTETQLVQHIRAFKFLCSSEILTKNVILETHKILMDGAFTSDHKGQINNILNGELRTFGVNNGIEDYMPFCKVEESLDKLIKNYNSDLRGDAISKACRLFWDFLVIHPFEDGNGRMARMLASFSLMKDGTPFPVIISSGKRRSRRHYNKMIQRHSRSASNSGFYTMISFSLYLGWKNFLNLADVYDQKNWIT